MLELVLGERWSDSSSQEVFLGVADCCERSTGRAERIGRSRRFLCTLLRNFSRTARSLDSSSELRSESVERLDGWETGELEQEEGEDSWSRSSPSSSAGRSTGVSSSITVSDLAGSRGWLVWRVS